MYISNFLGQNAPLVATSYVAGEAVAKGQIAVLGADGMVYYALDPSVSGANMRPVVNTSAQSFPAVVVNTSLGSAPLAGTSQMVLASCVLSNGNFVLAWQDYASGNVELQILSPLGVAVAGPTVVAAGQGNTDGNSVQLQAIPGGGFFIVFASLLSSTYYVRFAAYANTGAVAIAPTTVDTFVTGGNYGVLSIGAALLSNGSIAIAYAQYGNTAAASIARYAVLSSTGAVVSAAATLAANSTAVSATGPAVVPLIAVAALSGGGFVVHYQLWQVGAYFQRFNSTGVLQGAATQVLASSAGSLWLYAIGLTGGGFALAVFPGVAAKTYVYLYNATGVAQGSAAVTASASNNVCTFQFAAMPDGTLVYAVTFQASGTAGQAQTIQVGRVTAAAALVGGTPITLTPTAKSYGNAASYVSIVPLPDGTVFLTYPDNTSGLMACATINAGFTGLQIQPTTIGNTSSNNPAAVANCPALVLTNPIKATSPIIMVPFAALQTGSQVNFGFLCFIQSMQQFTPIGVFVAAALQGAATSIQYTGAAPLATGFIQPYNVNAQGNSPPGVKMSIVGNMAALSGTQAPAMQRAIS